MLSGGGLPAHASVQVLRAASPEIGSGGVHAVGRSLRIATRYPLPAARLLCDPVAPLRGTVLRRADGARPRSPHALVGQRQPAEFGIAVSAGVLTGSLAAAEWRGEFRLETFRGASKMRRHAFGATLTGVGRVAVLGCSIRQGVSGVSTRSAASLLAVAGMGIGPWPRCSIWRGALDAKPEQSGRVGERRLNPSEWLTNCCRHLGFREYG